ncbi:MAG: hypothetical protein M3P23_01705, partial [Actinomycetota bacterium]|nr:hypothetical protein [Actinomycetota bacterium]
MPSADPLAPLGALPGVAEAVDRARAACTALRWHPGLRRGMAGAQAESTVRAARASAALEGAELPLDQVRLLVGVRPVAAQGNAAAPPSSRSPIEQTVLAALRVTAASAEIGTILSTAPAQAFAKLHLAAAADQAAPNAARADRADRAD